MSNSENFQDTGMTSVFYQGVDYERERIIKLLEGEKFILPEGIDEGTTLIPIQQAIALIKGEQHG